MLKSFLLRPTATLLSFFQISVAQKSSLSLLNLIHTIYSRVCLSLIKMLILSNLLGVQRREPSYTPAKSSPDKSSQVKH